MRNHLYFEYQITLTFLRSCRGGGIGRRKGLKIPRKLASVPVRVRPSALLLPHEIDAFLWFFKSFGFSTLIP